jgi:hypothetical protein
MNTLNYIAIVKPHTLQITTAHAKYFQPAFTSGFQVTVLNNGNPSTAPTKSSLHRHPYNYLPSLQLTLNWTSKLVSLITIWHGPRRKHRHQQFSRCCVWISCRRGVFTALLRSNGRVADHRKHRFCCCMLTCRANLIVCDRYLVTGLQATIFREVYSRSMKKRMYTPM